MSNFARIAAEVQKAIASKPRTAFSRTAEEVRVSLEKHRMGAQTDRDAEWQRVNSYIADVLKDSHVLYAKLARLQGDFLGEELSRLEKISESVLIIGDELSKFSKAFYDGKYSMLDGGGFAYGDEGGAGAPDHAAPPQSAPPEVPMEVQGEEGQAGGQEQAGQGEAQEQEAQE